MLAVEFINGTDIVAPSRAATLHGALCVHFAGRSMQHTHIHHVLQFRLGVIVVCRDPQPEMIRDLGPDGGRQVRDHEVRIGCHIAGKTVIRPRTGETVREGEPKSGRHILFEFRGGKKGGNRLPLVLIMALFPCGRGS